MSWVLLLWAWELCMLTCFIANLRSVFVLEVSVGVYIWYICYHVFQYLFNSAFFFSPVCTSESNYLVLIALDREFNVCERCQVDILEIETLCECDIAIMSASHIFLFVLWSWSCWNKALLKDYLIPFSATVSEVVFKACFVGSNILNLFRRRISSYFLFLGFFHCSNLNRSHKTSGSDGLLIV